MTAINRTGKRRTGPTLRPPRTEGAVTAAAARLQLNNDLHRIAWSLHALGLAFADPTDSATASQLTSIARTAVAQLAQDDDDRLSAQTCIDIMVTLWPHAAPEDCGHADWWRTPLGQLCARSLSRDDAESVSQSVAAAMLGVTRGTVSTLVHRGTLDRHPDGGVLRASVLQRIHRLAT